MKTCQDKSTVSHFQSKYRFGRHELPRYIARLRDSVDQSHAISLGPGNSLEQIQSLRQTFIDKTLQYDVLHNISHTYTVDDDDGDDDDDDLTIDAMFYGRLFPSVLQRFGCIQNNCFSRWNTTLQHICKCFPDGLLSVAFTDSDPVLD
jgi:hypothetical protein